MERNFIYIGYDIVDHELPEVMPVPGMQSCFYFDGRMGVLNLGTTLLYGELSCFCEPCRSGTLTADRSTIDCASDGSIYTADEVICAKVTTQHGHGADTADLTAERIKRAKILLANGRRSAAKGGEWVVVFIPDLYGEREKEKGGHLAPVQLWGMGKDVVRFDQPLSIPLRVFLFSPIPLFISPAPIATRSLTKRW